MSAPSSRMVARVVSPHAGAGPPPRGPGALTSAQVDRRLGDLQEKVVQLRALLVVEHSERAVVLDLGDLHHVRDRVPALSVRWMSWTRRSESDRRRSARPRRSRSSTKPTIWL